MLSIFPNTGTPITQLLFPKLIDCGVHIDSTVMPNGITVESSVSALSSITTNTTSLSSTTLLRKSSDAALLVHAILDSNLESFFPVVDFYNEQTILLQDLVIKSPQMIYTQTLHVIATELGSIRKIITPLKKGESWRCLFRGAYLTHSLTQPPLLSQVFNSLQSNCTNNNNNNPSPTSPSSSPLISSTITLSSPSSAPYFNDIAETCISLTDEIHELASTCTSLIDLTFNSLAHSTNNTMKTLAVVSLVFLPLSFLCGVYGMNFDVFPELHLGMGVAYFWCWVTVILILVFGMARRYDLLRND